MHVWGLRQMTLNTQATTLRLDASPLPSTLELDACCPKHTRTPASTHRPIKCIHALMTQPAARGIPQLPVPTLARQFTQRRLPVTQSVAIVRTRVI